MTIAFYSKRPSNGMNNLVAALREAGRDVVKLKTTGSTRRFRAGDVLVNWGNSSLFENELPSLTAFASANAILNQPEAIGNAVNKATALQILHDAGVSTVDFTTSAEEAQRWLDSGTLVYARTKLSGHSGDGIVLAFNNPAGVGDLGNLFTVQSTLPRATLYTKAVMSQRREWRFHVAGGNIIHTQQKKRADGREDNPAYSNLVRNHSTGWIYATQDVQPNRAAKQAAVAAVSALGLDFGAVDIITRGDDAWVLEVNTACGQEAPATLAAYVSYFSSNVDEMFAPAAPVETNEQRLEREAREAHQARIQNWVVDLESYAAEVMPRYTGQNQNTITERRDAAVSMVEALAIGAMIPNLHNYQASLINGLVTIEEAERQEAEHRNTVAVINAVDEVLASESRRTGMTISQILEVVRPSFFPE